MKSKELILSEERHDFDSLVSIMAALRAPDGCPWDREQTHKSVRRCLIEETYEVIEAIDADDAVLLREELGDLMFQIMFHSYLESEKGAFTIDDVLHDICAKMIERHPHVFASLKVDGSEKVIESWDAIKKKEKSIKMPSDEISRAPKGLPAILKAQKLQGKAKRKFSYGYTDCGQAVDSAIESLKNNKLSEAAFAICAAAEMQELDLEEGLDRECKEFLSEFSREFDK